MPDDLRRRLRELHEELEKEPRVDAASRRLLETLTEDIDRVLDRDDEDESLADRVAEAKRDFEDSHPHLAVAIGRVADALSRLGI